MNILENVNSKLLLDSRQAALYAPLEYRINKSCSQSTWNFYSPDGLSNTSATWSSVTPPSKDTIIDRRFYVRVSADFTLANRNGNILVDQYVAPLDTNYPNAFVSTVAYPQGALLDTQTIGLRAYPLNHVIGSTNLNLNSSSLSNNTQQFAQFVPFTFNRGIQDVYDQTSVPDMFQEIPQFYRSALSPLSQYGTSAFPQNRGNGSISYELLGVDESPDGNLCQSCKIRATWYEPILLPKLLIRNGDNLRGGLSGISNINLVLTFGDLTSMLSVVGWGMGASWNYLRVTSATINSMQLLLQFLTPSPILPPLTYDHFKYNYTNIYSTVRDYGNSLQPTYVNNNISYTLTSNNIQLATIPGKIIIYVGKSTQPINRSQLTTNPPYFNYNVTDTFCSINSVSINFNNQSGLMSSASPYQLWQTSVQNGLYMSYEQFHSQTGSVIILDLSRDLPSSLMDAVGSSSTNNFSLQVNFSVIAPPEIISKDPISPSAVQANPFLYNWSLYTHFCYDEILSIGETSTVTINSFDRINVMQDAHTGKVELSYLAFEEENAPNAFGGSMWSDIKGSVKRMFHDPHAIINSVASALKAVLPTAYGQAIDDGARALSQFQRGNIAAITTGAKAVGELPGVPSFAGKALQYAAKNWLTPLVEKYSGRGYSPAQIRAHLSKQYPMNQINEALAEVMGGEMVGGDMVGGARVCKSRLTSRRY